MREATPKQASPIPHIVVVGGGLAGLSAAYSLADAVALSNAQIPPGGNLTQCNITLLESKRITGGRAGSFADLTSGESIDYCQHVAMGCCTNLIAMLKRFKLLDQWKRYHSLVFHHPDCRPSTFSPSRWLPAPMHLAACIGQLNYLTRGQKREVRYGMWRLMRTGSLTLTDQTARDWLQGIGQSDTTIEAFWDVFLVSALGEKTNIVSMQAARKVLIDGFAAVQGASDVLVPSISLSKMFGELLPNCVRDLGVNLRCQSTVKRIDVASATNPVVELTDGVNLLADHVIAAVPWYRLASLFDREEAETAISNIGEVAKLGASPISGIHLWLDRPIMTDDHAVMVGTTTQWVFRQPIVGSNQTDGVQSDSSRFNGGQLNGGHEHYHQVVISASGQSRILGGDALLETVLNELRAEFPIGRDFKLLRHRIVTDPNSVFSVSPMTESIRRMIRPALPCLHLAGDWVNTGWPSTMESAVISGRTAARSVALQLNLLGEVPIDPGLPWGRLAKFLIRK